MVSPRSFAFERDTARRWSVYAGLYMCICGTVMAILLSDVLSILADAVGLPSGYWTIVVASPAIAIGAVVWWAVIERHDSHTYRRGIVFGLLTALLTGVLWTGYFITIWGFEMAEVPIIAFFIGLVLAFAALAGVLSAIPLMYARHRLDNRSSDETNHPI